MLRVINLIAWGLVVAVVVYVLAGLEHAPDSRTEVVRINSETVITGSDTDIPESSGVSSKDDLGTPDVGPDPDAANQSPVAVILNDSGAVLLAAGDPGRAKEYLKRALNEDPDYARAHYNLGITYQKLNRLADAIAEYQKAALLRPHYYEPAYNLGRLYSKLEEDDSAVVWLQKAAETWGSQRSAPAHYNLGIVYRRLGLKKKSEKSYNKAIRLQPAYIGPRFNLGLLLKSEGRYREAANQFEKVSALGFRPAKVLRNLGICYSNLGLNKKAAEAYQEWAELDSLDATSLYNLAITQAKLGDTAASIKSYRDALSADSSLEKAAYNLAFLFSKNSHDDSAKVYYRRAAAINPSYSKAVYNLAAVFYDEHDYDSAALYYQKVVDLDPENHKALYNLALSHAKTNRLDEAIAAYRLLIDQNPTHTKAINNLGTAYLDSHQYDSALTYFNRLVGLTNSPQAYFNRAKTYHRLDSLEASKRDYSKAIERREDYAAAYHNLAILEEKTGNEHRAIDLLEKALEYEPHNWKSYWKLGQVYVNLGLNDKALEAYAKAAAENPSSDKFRREYDELKNKMP